MGNYLSFDTALAAKAPEKVIRLAAQYTLADLTAQVINQLGDADDDFWKEGVRKSWWRETEEERAPGIKALVGLANKAYEWVLEIQDVHVDAPIAAEDYLRESSGTLEKRWPGYSAPPTAETFSGTALDRIRNAIKTYKESVKGKVPERLEWLPTIVLEYYDSFVVGLVDQTATQQCNSARACDNTPQPNADCYCTVMGAGSPVPHKVSDHQCTLDVLERLTEALE